MTTDTIAQQMVQAEIAAFSHLSTEFIAAEVAEMDAEFRGTEYYLSTPSWSVDENRTKLHRYRRELIRRLDAATAADAHPDTWAVADLADWPLISGIRWSATKRQNGLYVRNATVGLLHRFLLSAAPGSVVDHRDGKPLNNRRENIRECTQELNNQSAADRVRGYAVIRERAEAPTSPHIVRARLADGRIKEYAYPSRSKTGTKSTLVCKIAPSR